MCLPLSSYVRLFITLVGPSLLLLICVYTLCVRLIFYAVHLSLLPSSPPSHLLLFILIGIRREKVSLKSVSQTCIVISFAFYLCVSSLTKSVLRWRISLMFLREGIMTKTKEMERWWGWKWKWMLLFREWSRMMMMMRQEKKWDTTSVFEAVSHFLVSLLTHFVVSSSSLESCTLFFHFCFWSSCKTNEEQSQTDTKNMRQRKRCTHEHHSSSYCLVWDIFSPAARKSSWDEQPPGVREERKTRGMRTWTLTNMEMKMRREEQRCFAEDERCSQENQGETKLEKKKKNKGQMDVEKCFTRQKPKSRTRVQFERQPKRQPVPVFSSRIRIIWSEGRLSWKRKRGHFCWNCSFRVFYCYFLWLFLMFVSLSVSSLSLSPLFVVQMTNFHVRSNRDHLSSKTENDFAKMLMLRTLFVVEGITSYSMLQTLYAHLLPLKLSFLWKHHDWLSCIYFL